MNAPANLPRPGTPPPMIMLLSFNLPAVATTVPEMRLLLQLVQNTCNFFSTLSGYALCGRSLRNSLDVMLRLPEALSNKTSFIAPRGEIMLNGVINLHFQLPTELKSARDGMLLALLPSLEALMRLIRTSMYGITTPSFGSPLIINRNSLNYNNRVDCGSRGLPDVENPESPDGYFQTHIPSPSTSGGTASLPRTVSSSMTSILTTPPGLATSSRSGRTGTPSLLRSRAARGRSGQGHSSSPPNSPSNRYSRTQRQEMLWEDDFSAGTSSREESPDLLQ